MNSDSLDELKEQYETALMNHINEEQKTQTLAFGNDLSKFADQLKVEKEAQRKYEAAQMAYFQALSQRSA